MVNKTFKKVLSVILSLCMIISLFTCMSVVPSSAAANDTKMLYVHSTSSANFFGYRTTSGGLSKETKYRLSLDWENINSAPFGDSTFSIYAYSGGWKKVNSSSLTTEWNVTSYALEHGYHYDIDFTTSKPSELREFVLYFGDINKNLSNMEFKTANWVLYTRDANNNLTDTNFMPTFGSVSFRGASDNAMNSYISSYTASDKGQIWKKNTMSSNSEFVNIPDGYFNVKTEEPENPEEPEPEPEEPSVPSDLVEIFANGQYSCLKYTKSWSTIKAGNYRFTMDCKIFSGTPVISVGNDANTSLVGTLIDGYQSNYVATYDAENFKYIITFTMDSDWAGNLGVLVGNYDQADLSHFACASPTLYLLDSNGKPTGDSLINSFLSDHYSSERAGNKWNRRNMGANMFTCTNPVPDDYFTAGSEEPETPSVSTGNMFFIKEGNRVIEVASKKALEAEKRYTFTCRMKYDTAIAFETISDLFIHFWYRTYTDTYSLDKTNAPSSNFLESYDATTCVYTASFTMPSDLRTTENFHLRFGDFEQAYGGKALNLYIADLKLYCDGAKVDVFPAISEANTYISTDRSYDSKYRVPSQNMEYGTDIQILSKGTTFPEIDEDDVPVEPEDPNKPEVSTDPCMVHFPAGYNNYHVLAYKGGNIAAGTYRFTVDEYAIGGIKSFAKLYVNDGFNTAVEVKSDTLSGNKRTVEFTLYGAKNGFLLMIGNYNLGKDMDTYYENPELYKVENDQVVGENMVDSFRESNLVFARNLTRVSAEKDKWSVLNWANGYVEIDDMNAEGRMLKLGGFGSSMNAISLDKALEPGVTYQFDMDYRANGGVIANKRIQLLIDGDYQDLKATNSTEYSDTGTHVSIKFTVPENLTDGSKNFRIYLGQSWPQKRNGTVYFANLKLSKVKDGKVLESNLITNGNFHNGEKGVVSQENCNIVFKGWGMEKVMTYHSVELLEIPEGFFIDDPEADIDKVYEFKDNDIYEPQFNFQFAPGKTYRLSYDYLCADNNTVNAYILSRDNAVTSVKKSRISDGKFRTTYDITVSADGSQFENDNIPNANIRFALNNNSYESPFSISNIKMYQIVDGEITGANLVYNINPILPDETYTFDEIGDKIEFILATDDTKVESQKKNIGISWIGNFSNTGTVENAYSYIIKTNGHLFDYYAPAEQLVLLRKTLLDVTVVYNPFEDDTSRYYDPFEDGDTDLKDLVRTKKNIANNLLDYSVENEVTNGAEQSYDWYTDGKFNITESEVDEVLSMQFTKPKNVIFMIGDGMGPNDIELTERKSGSIYDFGLILNKIPDTGFSTTHSASSSTTDSAASGTALATGVKTNNGYIGVSPTNEILKNVSEIARENGKLVGIVTNDDITGATPSAFAVHVDSRGSTTEIARQFVEFAPDVLIGQGKYDLENDEFAGLDLSHFNTAFSFDDFKRALNRGVSNNKPFLGFFSQNVSSSSSINTLSQCTEVALNRLKNDSPDGFFLMVENTTCDNAGHAQNINAKMNGVIMLDRSIAAVLKFMKENPDTLLVITSDHDNGAIQLPEGNDFEVSSSLFTASGHTATNVRTFAVGYGAEYFNNKTVDNTDIAKFVIDAVKE